MTFDWKHEAIDQFDWYWHAQFRPRLDGLTDDEYFWEPVPDCWSIRPRSEARTSMAAGKGDLVMDWEARDPDPAPVTTIAWRMNHIAFGVFGSRAANHFGAGAPEWDEIEWPATAAAAITYLEDSYAEWLAGAQAMDDAKMAEAVGDKEGYPEAPYAALVMHLNREAIHHGGEIGVLRDLYRAGLR
jgi:hypothetical protein